jgi:hypothetical protein
LLRLEQAIMQPRVIAELFHHRIQTEQQQRADTGAGGVINPMPAKARSTI